MGSKNSEKFLCRKFQLGESSVDVIVYKPQNTIDNDSYCEFEIIGIEGIKRRKVAGVDEILALQRIGIILDSYNKENTIKAERLGTEDCGFIYPNGYTDKWLKLNNLQIAVDITTVMNKLKTNLERIGKTIENCCSENEIESYREVVDQLTYYVNKNILHEIFRKFPSLH